MAASKRTNVSQAVCPPISASAAVHIDIHEIKIKHDLRKLPQSFSGNLADSIRKDGVLAPITVRRLACPVEGDNYEVVDGLARYFIVWTSREDVSALTTIPAVIVEMTDQEAARYAVKRNNQGLLMDVFGIEPDEPSKPLCLLAEDLVKAPDWLGFEVADLDKIVDGKMRRKIAPYLLFDGYLLSNIRKHIDSWIQIASDLNLGNGPEAKFQPAYARQRQALLGLMDDALSSYSAAFSQNSRWGERSDTKRVLDQKPVIELIKRYRLFTRYVCKFAKEVWPDVNLERLEQLT